MGTRGNNETESLHTCAANLLGVSSKTMGNKRHRLSGDMAFAFKKLTEFSKKIENLKLELQREAIKTTKSIVQSMIAIEEWSRKESKKQTLQLAQFFTIELKTRCPLDVQENWQEICIYTLYEYNIHAKCNYCMKHEFYLLNDVFYIKQQNVNLLSRITLYLRFK